MQVAEGTRLKLPLKLVEKLASRVNLEHYPAGYDKEPFWLSTTRSSHSSLLCRTRALILESVSLFNLNDVHLAFYRLGHRLASMHDSLSANQGAHHTVVFAVRRKRI